METNALTGAVSTTPAATSAAGKFGGDDFFKLLIAQLTNQDPLQPTSNDQLLQQISTIRNIDLNTNMVDSLKTLTGQQRFGAAANLIGSYVVGQPDPADPSGSTASGIVTGMRFAENGDVTLQLGNGSELSLDQVSSINDAASASQALIGKVVTGTGDPIATNPQILQGMVTSTTVDSTGRSVLELDTGEMLPLANVVQVTTLDEALAAAA